MLHLRGIDPPNVHKKGEHHEKSTFDGNGYVAGTDAPWFMTYDLDWDISNDMSIDEDTANAVHNARIIKNIIEELKNSYVFQRKRTH